MVNSKFIELFLLCPLLALWITVYVLRQTIGSEDKVFKMACAAGLGWFILARGCHRIGDSAANRNSLWTRLLVNAGWSRRWKN